MVIVDKTGENVPLDGHQIEEFPLREWRLITDQTAI